ncbi:MAG: damage-inducible protein CinA [Sulfurimonas sp. RIFOXYD12_FULL_33_39]|uniref:CinA family protein n=1 Tax=unclassified Sulfurimonas TaxID=2623549 RepID=UPI0008CB078D|nr:MULTISPECIES: CinA family protein [unclassified Sulfurimonas]OHE08944.1 MAG: damage-inducible protein CinA [Sulfurimonas sp. RIFOXYD12_FULL_33_39]OHE14254.1 MAG: damage-inducible protein CinA [Sulfurimonas sp. RIFOXYD2_FULL_34_21]
MKLHLLLIGNKFIYNSSLREYIIRKIEQKADFINSITFFKESDNSLFLYLEKELNSVNKYIIITTKQHFSTIGKLICTVTSDNQILKDGTLIPSNSSIFENNGYLLFYKESVTNVLYMDEMEKMPELLLNFEDSKATLHLFEEDRESAIAMLSTIAQTYDVKIDVVTIVDEWLRVDIRSKKYGNISKFINSAKQLLPKKIIASANLISYVIDRLYSYNKKIAFAESCSGGLLTYYFTKNNGASKILEGSLVTYSNGMKENWLGVNENTLQKHGAVSSEVVLEMSEGVMNVSSADYTISISGIAGDGGGSEYKPIGTVYVGVRSKTEHRESRLNLSGDRNYIQHQSVLFAVKMLLLMDKEMFF